MHPFLIFLSYTNLLIPKAFIFIFHNSILYFRTSSLIFTFLPYKHPNSYSFTTIDFLILIISVGTNNLLHPSYLITPSISITTDSSVLLSLITNTLYSNSTPFE